jgi:hypothetical protein
MPIFCISWAIVLATPGICSNSCKLDDSIERRLRYYSPNTMVGLAIGVNAPRITPAAILGGKERMVK